MKINATKLSNFTPIEIKIVIENKEELDHFRMICGETTPYDIGEIICKQNKKAKPDLIQIGRILRGVYNEIKPYF